MKKQTKKQKKRLPDWPNEVYLRRNMDCASGFEALADETELQEAIDYGDEIGVFRYDRTRIAVVQFSLLTLKEAETMKVKKNKD